MDTAKSNGNKMYLCSLIYRCVIIDNFPNTSASMIDLGVETISAIAHDRVEDNIKVYDIRLV